MKKFSLFASLLCVLTRKTLPLRRGSTPIGGRGLLHGGHEYFVLMLLFATITTSVFAAGGTLPGSGTEADPYLIEDLADFDAFADFANAATYWAAGVRTKLMTNIDLAGRTYTTAVIAPDTVSTNSDFDGIPFSGTFDGNGKSISKLTIDTGSTGNDYIGLFGYVDSGSEIDGVGIENCEIIGNDYYTATLAAYNSGTIINCYSNGEATSNYLNVGGLVAWNSGTITQCYSNTILQGTFNGGGGLVSSNEGTIAECYSTGAVGSWPFVMFAGGLVGWNSGSVSSSYSTGVITGDAYLGGLTGGNIGNITKSYSIGAVNGNNEYNGGLVGYNEGRITNSYWDVETSGLITSSGGESETTLQMKISSTFIAWDDGTWTINESNDYPKLTWENAIGSSITTDYPTATYSGSGTNIDPFVLSTSTDMVCMSQRIPDWGSYFIMANDIDMTDVVYVPIVEFAGNFDGAGHVIYNLTIDKEIIGNRDFLGLFGKLTGSMSNLGLSNINVYGAEYASTLVGFNVCGSISECYSTDGEVTGGRYYTGGLVGQNWGFITNSYSGIAVAGNNDVGGLAGNNSYTGNIENSFTAGTVIGNDKIGGLVGWNQSCVENCNSSGEVSGYDDVGGLVGDNTGSITNSYSNAIIDGDYSVGGLVGNNDGTITSCYSTGTVTGSFHSTGGLVGANYDVIASCYSTGTVRGDNQVGGLVGGNFYAGITNCYSTGAVTGNTNIGGLCGYQYGLSADIENSFWDKQTSQLAIGYNLSDAASGSIINVVGKTIAEMMTLSTFTSPPASWDFTTPVWVMLRPGEDYPRLAWQGIYPGDIAGLYGVDMVDFVRLASQWGETACHEQNQWCQGADIDHADGVDIKDLAAIAEDWLK